MINTPRSAAGTPSVSAMELRSSPGTLLDRVDYRNESFIIERAGRPKAVLVPVSIYRVIEGARERLFTANNQIKKAFEQENPEKVEKELEKAIKVIRNE